MDIYLPIAEMSMNAFVLIGAGLVVGFLSGLFGIGGGFLMTPFLTFMGIPAAIAVASQANQQVGTSLSGALAHWRKRNVDLPMALVLMGGSIVGTTVGVQLFKWLKQIGQINLFIVICYVSLLTIVGVFMLSESLPRLLRRNGKQAEDPHVAHANGGTIRKGWGASGRLAVEFKASCLRVNFLLPLGMGVLAGLLVSMLGVGGFVMVPMMIYVLKMPPRLVNGTSLVQIIFTSALSTVMQCVSNHTVDLYIALIMLVGSVIGVPLGARLSSRLPSEAARFLMSLLILSVAALLFKDLAFTPQRLFSVDVTVLP